MKKNLRIIQINGFRGICLALFVVMCLVAGFIAFPGLLTMGVWNFLADYSYLIPSISLLGGVLLWSIIIFMYFMFRKKKFIVSFKTPDEITDEEINAVMDQMGNNAAITAPTQSFPVEKTNNESCEDLCETQKK